MSTGIAYMDVEPFPRMKLMKLYYLTLEELKDLPDKYGKWKDNDCLNFPFFLSAIILKSHLSF